MKKDNLAWPSDARTLMGAIHNHAGCIEGQLIGLACEWRDGLDAQSQFVRNMRQAARDMLDDIDALEKHIYAAAREANSRGSA